MVERREPIDRVVDLAVAAPAATLAAALRVVPLAARAGTLGAVKVIERVSETVSSMREHAPVSEAHVAADHGHVGTRASAPVNGAAADEPVAAEAVSDHEADDGPMSPDDLPIEGYDDLAARQVVARLDRLDREDLDHVEAYERVHRNRSTVLGKIAALQA